jgi:hypothetical protein
MSMQWSPPVEPSAAEQRILDRCRKAKLTVFLRLRRHELFDDAFQSELATMYPERKRGRDVVAPAMLAMATLLQAWHGLSDEDAVEAAHMDRRWQLVLGTLDREDPPFSQGALFNFRQRLIAHDLDRRLLERTVALARQTRDFSHTALRAAFDSSPLFGAGRVEDTFNLLGHGIRDVVMTVAQRLQIDFAEAAQRAGVPLLTGTSLKAALDVDWDDPAQKKEALNRLLEQMRALQGFLERELKLDLDKPPLSEQWATVQQVVAQDIEPDPDSGGARIRKGVAKERRISIRDRQMRHGRKSKSKRVDGFKRHLAVDVESKLILAGAVTPANRPEGEAAGALFADVERQGFTVDNLHIDRAYLTDLAVEVHRFWDMDVHCKAFPLRNHGRFTKEHFRLDFEAKRITCPAGESVPLVPGTVARFPSATCGACAQQSQCTVGGGGRSLSVHAQEQFLVQLRSRQKTPEGRSQLRRRTTVEHALARLGRSQGNRARYVGVRKNEYDVRRHAAVANLQVAARSTATVVAAEEEAAAAA